MAGLGKPVLLYVGGLTLDVKDPGVALLPECRVELLRAQSVDAGDVDEAAVVALGGRQERGVPRAEIGRASCREGV